MKIFGNYLVKMVLSFSVLFLAIGSLSAQSSTNCDLSKCSPEERAKCAKICSGASVAAASLLNFFSVAPVAQKTNVKSTNCKPTDCQKTSTTNAKLVSAEVKTIPSYGSNLEATTEKVITPTKKKCCAIKCNKAKASL